MSLVAVGGHCTADALIYTAFNHCPMIDNKPGMIKPTVSLPVNCELLTGVLEICFNKEYEITCLLS